MYRKSILFPPSLFNTQSHIHLSLAANSTNRSSYCFLEQLPLICYLPEKDIPSYISQAFHSFNVLN